MTRVLSIICTILILLTALAHLGAAGGEGPIEEVNDLQLFINLKAARFDPLSEVPDIPTGLTYSAENNYYLVQCKGPIQQGWMEDLQDLGVVILGYVPEYTYLLFMEKEVKEGVEDLPFVRWIGVYQPAYKIEPNLLSKQDLVKVNVMVFDTNGDLENFRLVKDRILNWGCKILREELDVNTIVAEIEADKIAAIAFVPEVEWIDEYCEPVSLMDNIRVFTGAESPLHEFGFNGTGIVGEIKDLGIDQDHIEFEGRLIGTDGNVDEDSHGTSTFGIVFARGVNERATGMMPGGEGVFASWGVGRKQSIANLVNNWGGVFQSNSWHSGAIDGSYGSNTFQNDDAVFTYDATMLYATGNGGDEQAITQEAAGKNVIGVGATNHYNNQDRTDDRHNGNQGNKGPTADGRFKPDVVGPYDSIYTTTTNDRYTSGFGGTSGATPVAAGAVGLIYEMYQENHFKNNPSGATPHAATVKAVLIADAYQYEFAQADRYAQGWGLVDVGNVYNIGKNHLIDDESNLLRTGDTISYTITPTTATPLKISLVWTDVPGTTSSAMHLVNDLNLKVTDPDGNIYLGNHGLETSKWSATGGESDKINNVENVFIEKPRAGVWTIEVAAENIARDGVSRTPGVDQGYALVASGVSRYEHDLKVQAIGYPSFVGIGENVAVNATILNIGSNNEVDVSVELLVDNNTVDTTSISSIKVGEIVETYFSWVPAEENQYQISVYVKPVTGETSTWDNTRDGIISASVISGTVLVDDGHGTIANHDLYYYYLETSGPEKYRVHHTTQTITTPLLAKYDAFISVRPTLAYSAEELASLENFVDSGGGLVVIGETDQDIYNDLTGYAGIGWGSPYLFLYNGETTEINQHEITDNVSSLYFDSPRLPLVVAPPAEELVYTYGGVVYNRVTVAAAEYGQGKIVAVADSDCLNTQIINMADNKIFGMNIIKWLTNARPISIIDSPQDNSTYLVTDEIQFDGTSSYDPEGDALSYVWLSDIDGELGTSALFNTTLSAGLHIITLQVSDSSAKMGEAVIILRILAPPSVAIQYPSEGTLLNGAVEITGTASDSDGALETVEVQFDGNEWQQAVDTSTSQDWSEWMLRWDTTGVSDGDHRISVRSGDDYKLLSSIESIKVVIDNTPPDIIAGPEVYAITDTEATISWETDEPSSGMVEYGRDLRYGYQVSDESLVNQHIITLTGLSSKTTYHFRVSSADEVGNEPVTSQDNMFETKLPPDFTPPFALITSPSNNAVLTGTVSIEADVSDNQGVAKVEFYINDKLEFTDYEQDYYFLWDTTDGFYPDGQHSIRIVAADLSGNEASFEIKVILDNVVIPPSIELSGVTPGSVNAGEAIEVLFTVQVQDPENRLEFVEIDLSPIGGTSSQRMYDDGTAGDEVAGDNTYSFEASVSTQVYQGEKAMAITVTYNQVETIKTSVTLHVTPSQDPEETSEAVSDDEQEQQILWLAVLGMAVLAVIVGATLFIIDKRRRTEDLIEVEPLEPFEYR
ncbi:MAG: S8 family serine peptidase [Thermoplasmata archaeon]|nr:MAG: S8 family serine peptidase [Thermoplasmata archaeon]